jgi:NADH-quinone oxidoreductase subunit G
MVVKVNSEKAKRVRAAVEEFLLLNHPLDCPICDKAGECTLQNNYMEHDLQDSHQEFKRFKKRKAVTIGPTLVLDQERCVLCDRCVRFLRDIAGDEELYIAGRAHEARLTNFPGKAVTSPYSLNTVDLCPVGALTSRDFRFASPVWFMQRTPSVCPTCARGCSIQIDHCKGAVLRLRPRRNLDVNGYWMCDEGRLNYKYVNENRAEACEAVVRGKRIEVTYEEALHAALNVLAAGEAGGRFAPRKNIVLLASASSTLEEFYLLKKMAKEYLGGAPLYSARHIPDGSEDDLLRRIDRHSNVAGAKLLGIPVIDLRDDAAGDDTAMVREKLGSDGVLLVTGVDRAVSSAIAELAQSACSLVVLAARIESFTESAAVLIPGMLFAEKKGTVVNCDSRAQALHPGNVGNNYIPEGFDLPVRGRSQWNALSDMMELLKSGGGFSDIESVRKSITSTEPAFASCDLNHLGETGIIISGA